jgi:hypothetical protein
MPVELPARLRRDLNVDLGFERPMECDQHVHRCTEIIAVDRELRRIHHGEQSVNQIRIVNVSVPSLAFNTCTKGCDG